jgi:hypothetical protein
MTTEDTEYNQLLSDLLKISQGDEPLAYLALPLSDVSAISRGSKNIIIPDIIPNSFYWSGSLMKCKRSLGRHEGRVQGSKLHGSFLCPECGSTSTEQIPFMSINARHCIACNLIWQSYPCWCMLCGGYLWSAESKSDTVKCDKCKTEWQVETVQSAHLSGDIFVGDL